MSYFDENFTLEDFLNALDALDSPKGKFTRVPSYIDPQEDFTSAAKKWSKKKEPKDKAKITDLEGIIESQMIEIQIRDEQILNMYYLLDSGKKIRTK